MGVWGEVGAQSGGVHSLPVCGYTVGSGWKGCWPTALAKGSVGVPSLPLPLSAFLSAYPWFILPPCSPPPLPNHFPLPLIVQSYPERPTSSPSSFLSRVPHTSKMTDLAVWLFQQTAIDIPLHPLNEEDQELLSEDLPPPMVPGNRVPSPLLLPLTDPSPPSLFNGDHATDHG